MGNDNNKVWRFVGASMTGTSHLKTGDSCSDAFEYKLLPNGVIIVAVADGAGSAERGGEGAKLAVETAMTYMMEVLRELPPDYESGWLAIIEKAYESAQMAIEIEAANYDKTMRDYATTLVLVAMAEGWTACGLIGDSAAVALDNNDELISLCQPQKGEYANMTNFLSQPNALEVLDIQIRTEMMQGLAVMSDGLLPLAINIVQNKPYPPFFNPLFTFVASIESNEGDEDNAHQQLESFLDSERVNARTDDDKTLVLVRKANPRNSTFLND